jgi:hypothetical protein
MGDEGKYTGSQVLVVTQQETVGLSSDEKIVTGERDVTMKL